MKIGVIDLLAMPTAHWLQVPYRFLLTKQYASLMPQTVAAWCRQLGHETTYATYFGYGDPTRLLPDDLDILFVSSFTHVSPVAYALAKFHAARHTLTVLGGPHARAFPEDALRFYDIVVQECDKGLIQDILNGACDRHSIVSSAGSLDDLPSVEERLPFIKESAFLRGRPYFATTIPLLASTGCPYSCDFCIDWNTRYRMLSLDRLRADLRYIAENFPRAMITFHDPNLAAGWDKVLELLEEIPPDRRSRTVLEASLASLKSEDRLRRLRETRCTFIGVGIESWAGYSQKAGAGAARGLAKVPLVVEQLRRVADYVTYLQASFVFGLDVDEGDEPVEATRAFIEQAPFVWPAINIPQPFGNTPLHTRWLQEGRLLTTMPYYFYQMPFLVTVPRHYDPMTYYQKMIDMQTAATTWRVLRQRLACVKDPQIRAVNLTRTLNIRRALTMFRRTLALWRRDRAVLAFHHRETDELPAVYERLLRRSLGCLAPLLTRADLTPLTPAAG